jgi:heme/copper-type cytochrome/quinol oxidase subunit 4
VDPRYLNPNNYVHAIEFINVLTMFPMAVALFGILTKRIPRKKIKLMISFISVVQLTSTLLYYLTWYMTVKKGGKYIWYLLFDLPWIVMPVYGIIWGLKKNF